MTTHLIKLSVGPEKLSDLAGWQAHRLQELMRAGKELELIHITRNTPKRAEELLDGGSIYWVIKGWVCARQKLLALRPLKREGVPHCGLVLDRELIRVIPRKHRPFQGWRYLAAKDTPADMTNQRNYDELTDALQRELAGLGLL